jgi:hypothetical protein
MATQKRQTTRTRRPKAPADDAPAITLADLSDADRRTLLEQARAAARRNPVDVEGYDELSDRERAFRALMDGFDHAKGCPVQEGEVLGRVEGFESRRPPNPATGTPAETVSVLRCCECGGSTVKEGTLDDLVDEELENLEPVAAGGGESPDKDL